MSEKEQTAVGGGVMGIEDFDAAIEWQAQHSEINHAPCTARIVRALPKVAKGDTACARRMTSWAGLTLKDAMPLRIAGGLHNLLLSGKDDRLARVYSGQITDQGQVDALVCDLIETYDHMLLPWFDGPPQTNEAGRSASIMAGLLWLAQRVHPRFDLFELGASAGVNTMLDRYHFRLGETEVGPHNSPMRIEPEWRGPKQGPKQGPEQGPEQGDAGSPPTPPEGFAIHRVEACDIAPIDLTDEASALKLKSYVWPDAPGRMARIDAAVQLANEKPPSLVQMDAAEFAVQQLEKPQAQGTTKAMFHSIMWQYLPETSQQAITDAIEAAGAKASPDTPLAWAALETDPETFRHELRVRYWDGSDQDGAVHLLGFAHPHGAWVEWTG